MRKVFVFLLSAVFLLAMYAPVSAADWDLYGSARITTFWTDQSSERDDDTQLNHSLQGNSRVGAHVQSGLIGGRFEYGTGGGNANIRLLYGTYDLGPGQILVGQTYTPYGLGSFISNQVYDSDTNMLQFIGYNGRRPMVQYSVGNFSVALVQPVTPNFYPNPGETTRTITVTDDTGATQVIDITEALTGNIDGNPEVILPQLAARYSLPALADGISMDISGVIQSYELQAIDDERLTAWGVTANVGFTMMDPFYVGLGGFYGQNVAHFGQFSGLVNNTAVVNAAGNSIEDTDTYGALLVLGTNIGTIGLQAGVGYVSSSNDEWAEDDEAMAYYLQARIPVIGSATITPEIGYYDYMDDVAGNDAGDDIYVGLQWRVDF